MPRLAICGRDLHGHWTNRTLLCDTMEVSMLRRAWLTMAQHVFQCSSPLWQVGQSWFSEKLSPVNRKQRLSRWPDFAKNCLPPIGSKVLLRFCEKYRAPGRKKMGSNKRPRYIQFYDINYRDISGVHCSNICGPVVLFHCQLKSCCKIFKDIQITIIPLLLYSTHLNLILTSLHIPSGTPSWIK